MDRQGRTRMGSIYKGGQWFADFTVEGKRFRPKINASSKREANHKSIIERKKKITELAKTQSDIPFSEAMLKFLNNYCGLTYTTNGELKFQRRAMKESSAKRYLQSIKMVTPHFQGRMLKDITRQDIAAYVECRREGTKDIKPCNDPTIIRDLSMLGKMYEYIIKNSTWDGHNIVRSFDRKTLQESKDRIRSLDDYEKKSLLDTAKNSKNPDLYHQIRIALLTGMRWNEQFSLLRTDFERTNYGPQFVLRDTVTKNGKIRVVPLCDEALDIVEILLKKPASFSGHLFYNPDTGHRVKSNRSSWETCLKNSGVTNFSWHDLRHTYATDEIRKGMPIYTLSKLLGHSNVTITEKYAHLFTEDLHKAKRKVDTNLDTHSGEYGVSA